MLTSAPTRERGSAMVLAIALLVLGAFVAVAIIVSAMSSNSTARRQQDVGTSEQIVRNAGEVIAASYSAMESGEFDGFVPRPQVLQRHVARDGGRVIANPAGFTNVQVSNGRTVELDLDPQRYGYWQIYDVQAPRWGITPNATVKVYVRTWTRPKRGGDATRPMIYELQLRPEWFADFQILVDGKLKLGSSAKIDGRVHSNGTLSSIFNVYRDEPWQISIGDTGDAATCTSTARITSASGTIKNKPSCIAQGGKVATVKDMHVNILRAQNAIDEIRDLCSGAPAATRIPSPQLTVVCPTTAVTTVNVSGNSVKVNGSSKNAKVTAGGNQGVVVVANGDVRMTGSMLGAKARLLVIAASPGTSVNYGTGGRPPSIYIQTSGQYGADPSSTQSSFGLIAQGSIVVDEQAGCPSALRGAFLSISSGITSNPTWITPMVTGGGKTCAGQLKLQGSIVGHYQPLLYVGPSNAGFANRAYVSLPSLYHDPPPVFPTSSDWQVQRMAPANLDDIRR
ncbi:MAG: hypothetical protein KDC46_15335 [Thermoleophilia bacterium]|nr:hypothetical protein [Thermoleophilia bacterium]